MNPYFFSIIIGGLGGGILGYLISLVRHAPLFGILSGAICGMLIGPALLADLKREERERSQQKYKRGYVEAAKK